MTECERCGKYFDSDDMYWSEYYQGWVCEKCYQWLVRRGKE